MGPGNGVESAMVMKPVRLLCYFFLLPSVLPVRIFAYSSTREQS